METQITKTRISPLMWMTGIAITLFCAAGIAAIMGWIPTSKGQSGEPVELKAAAKSATAKPAAPRSSAPAQAAQAPKPVQVAAAPVAAAPAAAVRCIDCGVIESSRQITAKGEGSGLGVAGGAIVGGLLGNQVGDGRGQQIATVVGAVGGGIAGNEIEKRVKASTSYEVTVRLDNGSSRMIQQATAPAWKTGERVRIVDGVIKAI
jgi:outer membrane lipoprotein SlyB